MQFLQLLISEHDRFGLEAPVPTGPAHMESVDGVAYLEASGLLQRHPRRISNWLRRRLALASAAGQHYDGLVEERAAQRREELRTYDALAAFFRDEAGFARSYAAAADARVGSLVETLAAKAEVETRRHAALRDEAAASLKKLFSRAV